MMSTLIGSPAASRSWSDQHCLTTYPDAVMAVHPTAAEELVTMREKAMTVTRQAAE